MDKTNEQDVNLEETIEEEIEETQTENDESNKATETNETSESTEVVSKQELQRRLKAAEAKHKQKVAELEKQYKQQLAKEKMSKEEREAEEIREKDRKIAELEAEKNKTAIEKVAIATLSTKGYAVEEEVLELLIRETPEETELAILEFDKLVSSIVEKRVSEKLKTSPPKSGSKTGSGYKPGTFGSKLGARRKQTKDTNKNPFK